MYGEQGITYTPGSYSKVATPNFNLKWSTVLTEMHEGIERSGSEMIHVGAQKRSCRDVGPIAISEGTMEKRRTYNERAHCAGGTLKLDPDFCSFPCFIFGARIASYGRWQNRESYHFFPCVVA